MSFFNPSPVRGELGDPCYTDRHVVFHAPFTLGASAEVYPAGSYVVETESCAYEGNELAAHVRTSTVLVVPTAGGTRDVHVNGLDLDEALRADAAREGPSDPNENPDRGQANSEDNEAS